MMNQDKICAISLCKGYGVTIYMDDWQCAAGSGGHLRLRSNATAFHDLGWSVEVVRLAAAPAPVPEWALALGIEWKTETSKVLPHFPSKVLGRIQYRLGIPGLAACDYYFQHSRATREAVERRCAQGRLHFLEGIQIANALPFLKDENVIFSHHDVSHEATAAVQAVQRELDRRELRITEIRDLRFVRKIETRICDASKQILTISARDCVVLHEEGWSHARYLPMSVADTVFPVRHVDLLAPLRILHLGRITHLPSYRSLEFLLTRVFPLLSLETLDQIRLRVVGSIEEGNPRADRIVQLIKPFAAQIELVGFVKDLMPEFIKNDLQIIASTAASGLQTRIVESLARGLPVLTSEIAAQGLENPRNGESLVIASSAEEFANAIKSLVKNRYRIYDLATGGRLYFERYHSREYVAKALQSHLMQF